MLPDEYNNILLRISCILSILGSLLVMFVCSSQKLMIKQKGKYLIFWLSFSDFASSTIYLLSSLSLNSDHNSVKCQVYGLLGIFFPVASFLWTDFIAYYLYSMIVSRKLKTENEWKNLMIYFHIISWGVSALCITIVASFGHAGRSNSEEHDNTGGWCWLNAPSKTLILWEVIGGKFVEWMSAFIILPYFYFVTARTLMKLDRSWSDMVSNKRLSSKNHSIWNSFSSRVASLRLSLRNYFHSEPCDPINPLLVDAVEYFTDGDESSFNYDDQLLSDEKEEGKYHESTLLVETNLPGKISKVDESHNTSKFRRFYAKMALVPILFFLARIWGSIRIIIYASTDNENLAVHAANTWLRTLQAIFDTSQGFLNAIIFVFLSSENMNLLYELLCRPKLILEFLFCGSSTLKESVVEDTFDNNPKSDDDPHESSMYYSSGRPNASFTMEDNERSDDLDVSDEDKIVWDGQLSYLRSNNSPYRQIKCSFTEGNC